MAEYGGGALVVSSAEKEKDLFQVGPANGNSNPARPSGNGVPVIKTGGGRVISVRRLFEEVDAKRARTLISGASVRYVIFVS